MFDIYTDFAGTSLISLILLQIKSGTDFALIYGVACYAHYCGQALPPAIRRGLAKGGQTVPVRRDYHGLKTC